MSQYQMMLGVISSATGLMSANDLHALYGKLEVELGCLPEAPLCDVVKLAVRYKGGAS